MNLNNNYISNQSESAINNVGVLIEKYKTASGISPEDAEYLLSCAEASPDTADTSRDQAIMLLVHQYGFERCRGSDADVADRLYNVVKQEIQRGAPAMLKQLFPNATATEDFLKAYSFFHADEKKGKGFRITDILQSSMNGDDIAAARIHFAKQYIGAAAPYYVIGKDDVDSEDAKRNEHLMRDAAALTQDVLVDDTVTDHVANEAGKYLEEIVRLEQTKSNRDKVKAAQLFVVEGAQEEFFENTTTLVHVMAQVQNRNAETNYGIPVLELLEHGCDRAVSAAKKIRARCDLC